MGGVVQMKRFTETVKWDDPWFRKLPPGLKCLWIHLVDKCDAAGVIDPDWDIVSMLIGHPVSAADLKRFGDRIIRLPSGKLWLTKFISFQYGKLSRDCRPHAHVFAALERHGIDLETVSQASQFKRSPDRVSDNVSNRLSDSRQEKEEVQDKDKEEEKDSVPSPEEQEIKDHTDEEEFREACKNQPGILGEFGVFWEAYPKKIGRDAARKAWEKRKDRPPTGEILDAIFAQMESKQWKRDGGQFIPNPATWINQGRWADEVTTKADEEIVGW
jgi:hypothetical protein